MPGMMMRFLLLVSLLVGSACASTLPRADYRIAFQEVEPVNLRHYPGGGERVLLVGSPGITADVFDIPGYGGLATVLQERGFDVWVLDWADTPLTHDLRELARWTSRVLRHLTEEGTPVSVAAHGLGGVAVILGSTEIQARRYVFLAVPGDLRTPGKPIAALAHVEWDRPWRARHAETWLGRPSGDTPLLDILLWNYGVAPVRTDYLRTRLTPLGPRLLTEISHAVAAGSWGADFEEALAALNVPTTVLVGHLDAVAPPWQTYRTYAGAGSVEKRYRYFSRGMGDRREYGHVSILVGDDARREVFPHIIRGLR
jgi:pimeloyl-ACP methyl ester carboxylesterase